MIKSEAVSLLMNSQYYEQGYKQGVSDVLDKIRAEIEQFAENPNFGDLSLGVSCGAMKAIEIIDKYKAKSEDKK